LHWSVGCSRFYVNFDQVAGLKKLTLSMVIDLCQGQHICDRWCRGSSSLDY